MSSIVISSKLCMDIHACLGIALQSAPQHVTAFVLSVMQRFQAAAANDESADVLNRAFLEPSPPSSPAAPVPLTPPSPINAVEMEPAAAAVPAPALAKGGKAKAAKKPAVAPKNLPEAGRAPNLNKYPLMDAQWDANPLRAYTQIHIDFSHAGFKQTYHAAPRFTGKHVTFLMTEGPRVPCNSLNNAYTAAQELFLNYVNHQIPEPIEAREANGWLRWYVLDATTGKRISLQKLQQSVPRV